MGWFDFLFGDKNKDRDGSTPETAIIVDGIAAEYQWLRDHLPGYVPDLQTLTHIDGKPFDVLNVRSANGETRTIYFDISRFYGH